MVKAWSMADSFFWVRVLGVGKKPDSDAWVLGSEFSRGFWKIRRNPARGKRVFRRKGLGPRPEALQMGFAKFFFKENRRWIESGYWNPCQALSGEAGKGRGIF